MPTDTETDDSGDLREQMDDLDEDESWSMQETDRTGSKVGGFIAGQVATFVTNLMLLVTRIIPGTERFWRGVIVRGYDGLRKTSGADVIGHVGEQGQLEIEPLKWYREEGRYETPNGDYWNAADQADNRYLLGNKIPTVWAAGAANELGSHVQAEVAEVLDVGGGREVYRDAVVEAEYNVYYPDNPQGTTGADGAVADGGTEVQRQQVSVRNPGVLADTLVDLSHDGDARVVSMEKYYETYPSVVDPEEMQKQEDRGRLAEAQPEKWRDFAIKMMLIAGAVAALGIIGKPLINALFASGGGGGGGGIIPLVITTVI